METQNNFTSIAITDRYTKHHVGFIRERKGYLLLFNHLGEEVGTVIQTDKTGYKIVTEPISNHKVISYLHRKDFIFTELNN